MRTLFGRSGDNLLREVIQKGLHFLDTPEFPEVSSIQRADAGASCGPQGLQFPCILRFGDRLHSREPVEEQLAKVVLDR